MPRARPGHCALPHEWGATIARDTIPSDVGRVTAGGFR